MKFSQMEPAMQAMRERWAKEQAMTARRPPIDAFVDPVQIEIQTAQADVAASTAPPTSSHGAELTAWAARMVESAPRLFGYTTPGFIGPPTSGKARLWLTYPLPRTELPLPGL